MLQSGQQFSLMVKTICCRGRQVASQTQGRGRCMPSTIEQHGKLKHELHMQQPVLKSNGVGCSSSMSTHSSISLLHYHCRLPSFGVFGANA